LSAEEREALLRVANEPRFADVPPERIVPALADEGVYLAGESSFQRVCAAWMRVPDVPNPFARELDRQAGAAGTVLAVLSPPERILTVEVEA